MQRVTDPLSRPLQAGASTGASDPIVHDGAFRERVTAIALARNPLLEASQPLLLALADFPNELCAEKREAWSALRSATSSCSGQCAVLPDPRRPC